MQLIFPKEKKTISSYFDNINEQILNYNGLSNEIWNSSYIYYILSVLYIYLYKKKMLMHNIFPSNSTFKPTIANSNSDAMR